MLHILIPAVIFLSTLNVSASQNVSNNTYIQTEKISMKEHCVGKMTQFEFKSLRKTLDDIINGRDRIALQDITDCIGKNNLQAQETYNRSLILTMSVEQFYNMRFAEQGSWMNSNLWKLMNSSIKKLTQEIVHVRPIIMCRPTQFVMSVEIQKNDILTQLSMYYNNKVQRKTRSSTKKDSKEVTIQNYVQILKDVLRSKDELLIEDIRNCFGAHNVVLESNKLIIMLEQSKWNNLFSTYNMLWRNELLLDMLKETISKLKNKILGDDKIYLPYEPHTYAISFTPTGTGTLATMEIHHGGKTMDKETATIQDLFAKKITNYECESDDLYSYSDDEF